MEHELYEFLKSIKGKGRIQLQLHHSEKHTPASDPRKIIRRGRKNRCRVESQAIPGDRYKWFDDISEKFYNQMVDEFHNTY